MMLAVEQDWPRSLDLRLRRRRRRVPPPGRRDACAPAGRTCSTQPAEVQTAFALEAVLDEVVFVVGPILVDAARDHAGTRSPASPSRWSPASSARSPSPPSARTEPPAAPARPRTGAAAADAVAPRCSRSRSSALTLGALFGAAEVTTVAFAEEQGHKAGSPAGCWRSGPSAAWSPALVTGAVALAPRAGRPAALGLLRRWRCAMAPLDVHRLGPADGGRAARRRLRDRARP